MPWWAWLATGVALLVVEIAIQTEFWVAVLGAAALIVGIVIGFGGAGETWVQLALFAVLSVVLAVSVRGPLYRKLAAAPGLEPALIDEYGTARDAIAPGGDGTVELRGSSWDCLVYLARRARHRSVRALAALAAELSAG